MPTQVKMPQLGETVVEGTITRWIKREGEAIQADEPLVEVSTDKVDSEIPSPASGTVVKIHVQEGETVQVGALLAEIGVAGEAPASAPDSAPAAAPPPPPPPAAPPQAPAAPERAPAMVAATPEESRRAILSPLVRRLADEQGIDLSQVRGTGTGGRITKQDVLAFAQARGSGAAPAAARVGATGDAARPEPAPGVHAQPSLAAAAGGDETVQVGHMRKLIAEHMVRSHLESARAWNAVEVDMSRIASLRRQAGDAFKAREGFSLTWMPFVSKAVCQALLRYPQVNSSWNGDGTVTRKHYVNLGIAVALENGLIVPVIKGADGMNLVGLARSVRDLAVRARTKKLVPDEVQGGTFTITNPGPFGSIVSVPIINTGQTGILAFDAVTKRVVVVEDADGSDSIAIRPMVFLSMSWDHRVIDGAEAAQFLSYLKSLLETADFSADLASHLPQGEPGPQG